jgi:pimeloyl-ACP methyl ester carboxylesterase
MGKLRSRDGTGIAYEQEGRGPALVLVDGALCSRAFGPMKAVSAALQSHFTVFRYDRRGRGDSGNTLPYSVEREIEDLSAVIAMTGGPAYVCGISSGAALALETAACGAAVRKLALYEAPFIVDNSEPPLPEDFLARLEQAIAAGRPGDAVRLFLTRVGVPSMAVAMMRWFPVWRKLTAAAPTLPYDIRIVGAYQKGTPLPATRWSLVRIETLVMDGSKSPTWMRNAMVSLGAILPAAQHRTLAGQTHNVKPSALAPALTEFFLERTYT